jgi:isopenicillin-N N-acyltransferase like protein
MPSAQRPALRVFLCILASGLLWGTGCTPGQPALSSDGVVQRWLVLKPISIPKTNGRTPDEAAQKAAFARDWLQTAGGEANVQPRPGKKVTLDGQALRWRPAETRNGMVDLQIPGKPPTEYAVAYAWAEIEQPEKRKAYLGIGSDDAVKVWLNGRAVHENWTSRGVRLDDDLVPVELERGKNRLLLKVQNGIGPWGLGCRVMSEDEGQAIQAFNREIHALAEGDAAGVRASCYASNDDESRTLEAAAAFHASIARMRRAFDEAYGPGRLVQLGFRCITPDLRLPARPNFRMSGNRATLSPPGWAEIALIKLEDGWKELEQPWPDAFVRAMPPGTHVLPLEGFLSNLRVMGQAMDGITAEIRAGRYLSAADAYGVLNARLRGLAATEFPAVLAGTVDFTTPGARPATCPVPIIELRGDGAAIGKAHGAQLGDDIRLLQRDYLDRLLKLAGSGLKGFVIRQALLARAAEFKPWLNREHLAEIRALSASAGMDPRKAMLVHCFVELIGGEACSTITLPASASTDGVARFGRNMDYLSLGVLDRHSVLLVIHPKDRYAFASVTWPGLVGVTSGMNEHGLCLACMSANGQGNRKPKAMPNMLLYRCVLEQCKTVDEAIAFLEKTPRQTPHTLMLMDAAGNRAVTELTPEKVAVRRAPDTAALMSTNHHRGADLETPGWCNRFDYLHDAARRQFGQFSEAGVEELLTGAAQGEATLQSMVFEPANRVLYLAVGAGAPNHGFYRIDLKPYFDQKP